MYPVALWFSKIEEDKGNSLNEITKKNFNEEYSHFLQLLFGRTITPTMQT